METLTIERLDGTKEDIQDINGAMLLTCDDQGPQPVVNYGQMSGVDGKQDNGTIFDSRPITATFSLAGIDKYSYTLATRAIWSKLFSREPYYISWSRMPGMRYLVHCQPFQYSRLNAWTASYTVQFDAFKGYAESVGRTDLDPINMLSDKYQMIGQGFDMSEDPIYQHTESSFRIFNAGSETINPRQHFLLISIKGVGTPTLTNLTTGDIFQYNSELSANNELTIEGVYPKLNGVNCGRDTNHGLITIAPGWNDFELTGLNNPESTFGFYFLYTK